MNNSVAGRFVRLCTIEIMLFSEDDRKGFIKGQLRTFFMALLNQLQLQYSLTFLDDAENQGKVIDEKNGTGLIGALLRNECDLSVIPIPSMEDSYRYLSYTSTFAEAKWKMFSGKPKILPGNFFIILNSFDKQVWFSVMASLFVFPLLWSTVNLLRNAGQKLHLREYGSKLFDSFSVLVMQGPDFRDGGAAKFLYLSWLFAVTVISSSFCGCLLSKLTLPDPPERLEYMTDILKFKDFRLFIVENTTPHNYLQFSKKGSKLRLVWDHILKMQTIISLETGGLIETVMDIGAGAYRGGLVTMEHAFLNGLYEYQACDFLKGSLYMPEHVAVFERTAFAMNKKLDPLLTSKIRQITTYYFESGVQKRNFDFISWCGRKCVYDIHAEPANATKLNLKGLAFPVVMWIFGIFISVISIIFELFSMKC